MSHVRHGGRKQIKYCKKDLYPYKSSVRVQCAFVTIIMAVPTFIWS